MRDVFCMTLWRRQKEICSKGGVSKGSSPENSFAPGSLKRLLVAFGASGANDCLHAAPLHLPEVDWQLGWLSVIILAGHN